MSKVYYDKRTGEWSLDVGHLPQELIFEITISEDDKYHHKFITESGEVDFASSNDNEFREQFEKLVNPTRTQWRVPKEFFEKGCKYYKIKL